MSRKISTKTKQTRNMGKGEGASYNPYITTSEFNSKGTTSVIKDWKTGRGVHCLSQGEMYWFYILRWDDTNIDIREQYPLDYDETVKISTRLGFSAPRKIMTTDMLVTKQDGTYIAYSIKPDKDLKQRQLQLLCIEKEYWTNKGVDYRLMFKNDMNTILASNIRLVTEFYDANLVFDEISAIKHKIAIKELQPDLSTKVLEISDLKKILRDEYE